MDATITRIIPITAKRRMSGSPPFVSGVDRVAERKTWHDLLSEESENLGGWCEFRHVKMNFSFPSGALSLKPPSASPETRAHTKTPTVRPARVLHVTHEKCSEILMAPLAPLQAAILHSLRYTMW